MALSSALAGGCLCLFAPFAVAVDNRNTVDEGVLFEVS